MALLQRRDLQPPDSKTTNPQVVIKPSVSWDLIPASSKPSHAHTMMFSLAQSEWPNMVPWKNSVCAVSPVIRFHCYWWNTVLVGRKWLRNNHRGRSVDARRPSSLWVLQPSAKSPAPDGTAVIRTKSIESNPSIHSSCTEGLFFRSWAWSLGSGEMKAFGCSIPRHFGPFPSLNFVRTVTG